MSYPGTSNGPGFALARGRHAAQAGIGALVLAFHGIAVCPYLEALPPHYLALSLGLGYVLHVGLRFYCLESIAGGGEEGLVRRAFLADWGLFILVGCMAATFNSIAFHVPAGGGSRLVVGYALLGFFVSADLAQVIELRRSERLLESGVGLELGGGFVPFVRKLMLFSIISVVTLGSVAIMAVDNDLRWLASEPELLASEEAQSQVLADVGFIALVVSAYSILVIAGRGRNMEFFLRHHRRTLEFARSKFPAATAPVTTNDEFGHIAALTNEMLDALRAKTEELRHTRTATILSLASLAETRDNETGAHVLRTQRYVRSLAEELRTHPEHAEELDDETIELLFLSAPLHDVGKVGIPDSILLKPGKLTHDEFEVMKGHALIGGRALRVAAGELGSSFFLRYACEVAETHHEKWDGSGYPMGLKGSEIPLSGRLMALADVYDALISKRVYKPAFPHAKAKAILLEGRGAHFDPDVVDAFLAREEEFQQIARDFRDGDSTGFELRAVA